MNIQTKYDKNEYVYFIDRDDEGFIRIRNWWIFGIKLENDEVVYVFSDMAGSYEIPERNVFKDLEQANQAAKDLLEKNYSILERDLQGWETLKNEENQQ